MQLNGSVARDPIDLGEDAPANPMQGMGTFRLGRRTVMYTVEAIPKGKNRVLGVSDKSMGVNFGGGMLCWVYGWEGAR